MDTTTPHSDPEMELRALWNAAGVPQDKQETLLAEARAKAQPGAKVGPYTIPADPWELIAHAINGEEPARQSALFEEPEEAKLAFDPTYDITEAGIQFRLF